MEYFRLDMYIDIRLVLFCHAGIMFIPVFSQLFRRCIIKHRMKKDQSQYEDPQELTSYLDNGFLSFLRLYVLISIFSILLATFCELYQNISVLEYITTTIYIIVSSCVIASMDVMYGYDEAEINDCQRYDESIGSYWAGGAFKSYYEIVLGSIRERMAEFESENDMQFYIRKLVLVCPLSCDVRKTFTEKDERVVFYKDLRIIEHDQGANINRKYKNPVYKVLGDEVMFIAAESPNTLLLLWKIRENMCELNWKYHRDCFLKCLKDNLKDEPCVVLIYDDTGSTKQPLHKFLEFELNSIGKDYYS